MFELNGKEYSLQDVEQAAINSNLSLDEYVKKAGLKTIEPGKTNGVAETGATAGNRASTREYGIRIGRYFFGIKTNL
jgi:hypothetical protein